MCPVTQPIAGYLHRLILMRSVFILLPWKLRRRVRGCLEWYTVLYMTLYYNYFTTIYIALETLLEPMFWFVERFARYLGPIFVTLVTVMTTSVVTIFYVCLLPHLLQYYSIGWTIFHVVFGHWLLTNVIFHYVMAVFTQPGTPPDQNVAEVVSICKKCISPKPPRTHHCTICGKCILKMDHHCPWLNNCVGHHNHRYFFLFCVYMWFGTIYVSWSGHDVFRQHFYGDRPMPFPPFLYPLNAIHDAIYNPKKKEVQSLLINEDAPERGNYKEYYYHVAVLYQFILCSGITLALGVLMLWHAKLISAGETSIEVHINSNQRKKFKNRNLVYKNPYHYGFKKNWQVFLGFSNFRSFCRYVLLPSTHWPEGDGLTWARASYKSSSTRCLELL